MRKLYLQSFKKICDESVDIFMGNHTSNVDLLAKRKVMLEKPDNQPFIDDSAWKNYLNTKYRELVELINSEVE